MTISSCVYWSFYVDNLGKGRMWVFKEFSFAEASFHPHEAVQDFDLHLSAWLCLPF